MIPDLTDYYLVGLIYSYLGHLNRDEEHYKKALLYYEKALPLLSNHTKSNFDGFRITGYG